MDSLKSEHKGLTKTTNITPDDWPATDLSEIKSIISDVLDKKRCLRLLLDVQKGIFLETSIVENVVEKIKE